MIAIVCEELASLLDEGFGGLAYTWFSPLGDRNHEAAHMATMMMRPMKMEYLGH